METIIDCIYPNEVAENAHIKDCYKENAEILTKLQLQEFFKLCNIPHPSGNVGKMREYLYNWGINNNLETTLDESGCVFIDLPATENCKDYPPLIFQAHYDMVAIAAKNYYTFNKNEDSITPFYDRINNCVHTKWQTSLGADNGCGIATCLAFAKLHNDSEKKFEHGAMRFIFTYDEETTMQGASFLNKKAINSKYLINLDSVYIGFVITSSAGAYSSSLTKHMQTVNAGKKSIILKLNVWGLNGGHSGQDIDKNICSTSILMSNILEQFTLYSVNFNFHNVECGSFMNSIPSKLKLDIVIGSKDKQLAIKIIEEEIKKCTEKYDDGHLLQYNINIDNTFATPILSISDSLKIWNIVKRIPKGVVSKTHDGSITKSCNIGHISIKDGFFKLDFLFRTNNMEDIDLIDKSLKRQAESNKIDYVVHGIFPAWKNEGENPLCKLVLESYENACNFKGWEVPIHAGLECGLLKEKFPELIMVSIGCDIINEHTRKETLFTKSLPAYFSSLLYIIDNSKKLNK